MRRVAGITLILLALGLGAVFVLRYIEALTPADPQQALEVLERPARRVSLAAQPDFVQAVKKLSPAVVAIDVMGVRRQGFFLTQFAGQGSGVVISPDGYVVTNAHVVQGAHEIRVRTISGGEYDGFVVGKDEEHDVAVLKVRANKLAYAELGDSSTLQVGEWVLALGNPLGYENTLTVGVVSATNRQLREAGAGFTGLIQTDAAINQGNSGGALANIHGQVVGINTVIVSPTGGSIGLGFAVPINRVKEIAKRIISGQRPLIPYIGLVPYRGISLSDPGLREALAQELGVSTVPNTGVIVEKVWPLSPAQEAGLRPLDVIVSLNGRGLRTSDDFWNVLGSAEVGGVLKARVWRMGVEREVTIAVRDLPPNVDRGE
ncbi:MAG: trypsin-like peptidase domain-containing protein [Fimbriimonadia bacterium]